MILGRGQLWVGVFDEREVVPVVVDAAKVSDDVSHGGLLASKFSVPEPADDDYSSGAGFEDAGDYSFGWASRMRVGPGLVEASE